MKAIGIIPARLGSTRLSQKVLRPIGGKPMIYHVWQQVSKARLLSGLLVACDDESIAACVRGFGGKAVMTRVDHPNGSSRLAEAAAALDADVIVNIQGDEPLIDPGNIDAIVKAFQDTPGEQVVTLAVRKSDRKEYENPNVVKAVVDASGYALYFSRSPVPYFRDSAEGIFSYLKHLGIYGYRRDFLLKFITWESGALEKIEKLEQLRILERGYRLKVIETSKDSIGVDTEEDIVRVEQEFKKQISGSGSF